MAQERNKGQMLCLFCLISWNSYVMGKYVGFNTTAEFEGISRTGSENFSWSLNLPYLNVVTTGYLVEPAMGDVLVMTIKTNNVDILSCEFIYSISNICTPNQTAKVDASFPIDANFTINITLPQLNATYNNTHLIFTGKLDAVSNKTIVILEECDHAKINSGNQTISITPSSELADYNSYGNCLCSYPNANLYSDSGSVHSDEARCNATAGWTGCDDAQCWFAPTNITVNQSNTYAGESAGFTCNYSEGFPWTTSEEYFINHEKVPGDVVLNSTHYNNTYFCRVVTNYTKVTNEGNSSSNTLEIYFGPEILHITPSIVIPIGKTGEVYAYLKANDKDKNLTADLSKNGMKINGSYNNDSIYYNYSYVITVNSSDDYGIYDFVARTVDPYVTVRGSIKITETTPTTTPKTENIIIICAAIAGVIIILIVVLLLVRRYRRKSQDKEERLNPVYDTSAVDNSEKEDKVNPLYGSRNDAFLSSTSTGTAIQRDNEKEEKINPVYGTAINQADNFVKEDRDNPLYTSSGEVELNLNNIEVYAAVQKKEKKGKGGKNSPGFSAADSNATYSEVKKVNKGKTVAKEEVMYAEVQKGNKKGSGIGLHGTQD